MDIKGFASSKTEITLPNQDQQNLEKPVDLQTSTLAQSDVIEDTSKSSYFAGELLKGADFEGEQTYLSNSNLTNSDYLAAIKDQLKGSLDNTTGDGSELQFRIQTATSDLQDAESMAASLEKELSDLRGELAKNIGGGGGSGQQFPFESAINDDSRLGDFFRLTLDAMHGQPRNYDDLQKVVQDLKNLLNGLQIPNEQKLQLQNMLQQLDQLSHQIPIDQQQPDQNFAEALQLLNDVRAALAPFAQ